MSLRDLDDRLVPRLAGGLRRLLDRATPGRSASAAGLEPDGAGRGGLLGLLRDVPQLAALLVAVVFLAAGGLFVLTRSGDDRAVPAPGRPAASSEPSGTSAGTVLGPAEGTAIDDYLARAGDRTTQVATDDPDGRYAALVLLTDYATPAEVSSLLAGVEVRTVYVRAAPAGELAEVFEVSTPSELAPTLQAFYGGTASAKGEDATEFQGLADSIEATSEEENAAKEAYVADAQRASAEATAYSADCACVFTAVVVATAAALSELAGSPEVRGVELAGRGALVDQLQILPLQPEQQGVVAPPPGPPGGPASIPDGEGR